MEIKFKYSFAFAFLLSFSVVVNSSPKPKRATNPAEILEIVDYGEDCNVNDGVICDETKNLVCNGEDECSCKLNFVYDADLEECISEVDGQNVKYEIQDDSIDLDDYYCSADDPDCNEGLDKLKSKTMYTKPKTEAGKANENRDEKFKKVNEKLINKRKPGQKTWMERFAELDVGNKGYLTKRELVKLLNQDITIKSQLELNLHFWFIDYNKDNKITVDEYFQAMTSTTEEVFKTFGAHQTDKNRREKCLYSTDFEWASENIDLEFLAIDSDGNGCLSEIEYISSLIRFILITFHESQYDQQLTIDDLKGYESESVREKILNERSSISTLHTRVFTFLDKNQDNAIDKKEKALLMHLIVRFLKWKVVDIIGALDVNKDSLISNDEFHKVMNENIEKNDLASEEEDESDEGDNFSLSSIMNVTLSKEIGTMFSIFDRNGDGFIDQDEAYNLLLIIAYKSTGKEMELVKNTIERYLLIKETVESELLRTNDLEIAPSNIREFQSNIKDFGYYDESDFVNWLEAKPMTDDEAKAMEEFNELDADANGVIVKGEIWKAMTQLKSTEKEIITMWKKLDLNSDGEVTLLEFQFAIYGL